MTMHINNFDSSSTGLDLSLSIFFDAGLSFLEFRENIIRLSNGLFQYTSYGEIDTVNIFDPANYHATKPALIHVMLEWDTRDYWQSASRYNFRKPLSRLSKPELCELIASEIPEDALFELLEANLKPTFEVVEVTGYCQGDFAKVIIPNDYWPLTGAHRNKESLAALQSEIQHLFYDAPLHCRLEVNGDELDLTEYMDNIYTYDESIIIKAADLSINSGRKDLIIEWLTEHLPSQPRYLH